MKRIFTSLAALLLVSFVSEAQDKTKCLKFDGVDDKVVIPHHASLNLGRSAFTIEAWVTASPDTTILAPTVLSKKGPGISQAGWLFSLNDKGKVALQLNGVSFGPSSFGGGGGTGQTSVDFRDGTCRHMAWTREVGGVEDTVRGYQNGAYVKRTKKAAGTHNLVDGSDLWIGASEFNTLVKTYQFNGQIKEIRIWNYAKTETQINNDRLVHMNGSEPGLIFYWRLNENTGTTAYDCGPNKRNGAIDGATWETFTCDNLSAMPSPNNCMPGGPIGIEDVDAQTSITVYPNPVTDEIRLINNNNVEVDFVRIFDVNGRVVLEKNWTGADALNVSNFEKGTYLIQLLNNNNLVFKSLIAK